MIFHCQFTQRYNEGDLIQPVLWPLDTAFPVLFNQYIYFFGSKKNQQTFILNPLKYLRQSKPSPMLPIKMAIVGPTKSGKTSGESRNSFIWCSTGFNFAAPDIFIAFAAILREHFSVATP